MQSFINENYISDQMFMKAETGIIEPSIYSIFLGAQIYRFGNDECGAQNGEWWIEESELLRIQNWATLTGLSFAHAYRVLRDRSSVWGDAGGRTGPNPITAACL